MCNTIMHVQGCGEATATPEDAHVERARLQALLEGATPALCCLPCAGGLQLQASVHARHWLMFVVQAKHAVI